MNIGLDLDNVISDFNEMLLSEYIEHDKSLRNTGIINKNAEYIRRGMFDWSIEEELSFYLSNVERMAKSLKVKEGAKEYIDKLKQDGHNIYIITGRDNGEYTNPYEMTKQWLDNNNIYYDKLILTDAYRNDTHGKSEKCIENNVDIMIDDSAHICEDCVDYGIETLIMGTEYNRGTSNIPRVHSWKEIYEYISNYKKEKT